MSECSHKSSSQYKVNHEVYANEWQRIFGNPKPVSSENSETKETSDTKV